MSSHTTHHDNPIINVISWIALDVIAVGGLTINWFSQPNLSWASLGFIGDLSLHDLGILSGIGYTLLRAYYTVKNKGKEK
jgi:hypothetical protein